MAKILLTGATGTIGTELTIYLKDKHDLTLVDIDFSSFPEELQAGCKIVQADLSEISEWEGLLDDIEYVIQLAGEPDPEADFYADLLDLNYKLPHNLYQEVHSAPHVKRVIFASSIHAVGAYPDNVQVKTSETVRPNDLYGVSKAYLEALAAYHSYEHGIESIGIRIGDYKKSTDLLADDPRGMAMYFSAEDMNHLIDCALKAEMKQPFLLVNGISDNTFPRLDISQANAALGYSPKDNAFEIKGHFSK
ncbi:NAD-dependent epimerase/dehydratase family protein [Lacticigenium naphthae]|uniref:NAD-dependent epimerase/dehydratase family protein n=1 Tax=Lacticigenium naphthae TaxID=515351 RepID=UPI0004173655|nr:NAD(P)-dependent oxidoreductase [Lacticigenium naphthae]